MPAPDTEAERAELEVLRKALNRRAAIEEQLWAIFHGKRPPPTPEECREWAIKLGIPEEYQPTTTQEQP